MMRLFDRQSAIININYRASLINDNEIKSNDSFSGNIRIIIGDLIKYRWPAIIAVDMNEGNNKIDFDMAIF